MTHLSPIMFQSAKKVSPANVKKEQKIQNTNNMPKIHNNSNPFAKTLMGLAIIGAATLQQACTQDDDLFSGIEHTSDTEQIDTMSTNQLDSMLKTLGLLGDSVNSVKDIKTISFADEDSNRHYLKPRNYKSDEIVLRHSKVNPDFLSKEALLYIENADDGLDVVTMTKKDTTESKYILGKNGITEYKNLNGILVENSNISKREDGAIVRTFANGETKIYNNVKNNESVPARIEVANDSIDADDLPFIIKRKNDNKD